MQKRLLVWAVVIAIGFGANLSIVGTAKAVAQTSYAVQWAFNDPPMIPHYGAFYSGTNGRFQYYSGIHGTSAYSSWNWWPPTTRYALLLEKTWLLNPLFNWERGNPIYHHAEVDCPC